MPLVERHIKLYQWVKGENKNMREFFEICARKGITLTLKDGKNISYRTSKGPLEKDILAYLKEHKTEIIEYLKSNEQADKMIDESKIICY